MPPSIPEHRLQAIKAAVQAGNKIEAIKLYREVTGVGLKEAKDAVEALADAGSLPMADAAFASLSEVQMAAIKAKVLGDEKIAAIKLYREAAGCDLKTAKEAVEGLELVWRRESPGQFKAAPRRGGCLGLLVLGMVAGLAFWLG